MNVWLIRLFLTALVAVIFTQTAWHEFVDYDDQLVITQNPDIVKGLRPEGIAWAFTTSYFANWMPLTWLTHLTDWELYQSWAGGHHLTSVLLHLAAVLLLFEALRMMTGQVFPSFWVAAIYAAHPMHVESVAWIAERKGNLSSVFWMLTMVLYAHYVNKPSPRRMAAVAGSLVAGLMSKQMLVTLPAIFLLLDFWPLRRRDTFFGLRGRPIWPLLWEKWALFLIAIAFMPVAYFMQERGAAISTFVGLPIEYRLQNIVYSAVMYLRRFFWPSDLAVFYPHPKDSLSQLVVASCLGFLILVTIGAFLVRKRMPWIIVGWFWYLVALAPVCGIIPIGSHGMADRYGDIPLIGIEIAAVWTVCHLAMRSSVPRLALAAASLVVIGTLAVVSFAQTAHWRTSTTLFDSILKVDPDNLIAHNGLGVIALNSKDLPKAASHFKEAIAADNSFVLAHMNLGTVYNLEGKKDEAIAEYREAGEWRYQPAWFAAARLLGQQNKSEEAIACCEYGFDLGPATSEECILYGVLLLQAKRNADAEKALLTALSMNLDSAEARLHLGFALLAQQKLDAAQAQFAWAVALNPDLIAQIETLVKSSNEQDPVALDILAACYSQINKFGAACKTCEAALLLAARQGNTALIPGLQERLRSYLNNINYLQHAATKIEGL